MAIAHMTTSKNRNLFPALYIGLMVAVLRALLPKLLPRAKDSNYFSTCTEPKCCGAERFQLNLFGQGLIIKRISNQRVVIDSNLWWMGNSCLAVLKPGYQQMDFSTRGAPPSRAHGGLTAAFLQLRSITNSTASRPSLAIWSQSPSSKA